MIIRRGTHDIQVRTYLIPSYCLYRLDYHLIYLERACLLKTVLLLITQY